MADELLSYNEAAVLLSVSRSTVIRWTRPGPKGEPPILRALKLAPHTVRIRKADVEALLSSANRPGEASDEPKV